MELQKKSRRVLRTSFTKGAKDFEEKLRSGLYSSDRKGTTVGAWNTIASRYEAIRQKDAEIYEGLLVEATEEDLLAELEGTEGYQKKFDDLKCQYENLFSPQEDDVTSQQSGSRHSETSGVGEQGRRTFKLPVIEFKKFNGDIKDWLSFWAQFRKIDEDSAIDAHDKISYLIQATVPGSRARQVVESFPPMQENYSKIVECLKARFGREDLQTEVYVRELLKLIVTNSTATKKLNISILYDKIETQLRALETLGITKDKCAAMLYPMIESCLPENLIRTWQRTAGCSISVKADQALEESPLECRLDALLNSLRNEVENEQRITLAMEGLGLPSCSNNHRDRDRNSDQKRCSMAKVPTAAGFVNCDTVKCVFCAGTHPSDNCFKAQRFELEQKKNILSKNKACFRCLKIGHLSRNCRSRVSCILCGKSHITLMCPELSVREESTRDISKNNPKEDVSSAAVTDKNLACHVSSHVFLQTLRVKLVNGGKVAEVRALLDSGSQRSYILKTTARKVGYASRKTEKLVHSLFGGNNTAEQLHNVYDVKLEHEEQAYRWEVLDNPVICNNISPIPLGPWMQELKTLGIQLSDIGGGSSRGGTIELLIGAVLLGDLYTGRKHILKCGLVAMETYLGWTLMGKTPGSAKQRSDTMLSISLFTSDASVSKLWDLDVLGILDPLEKKSREEEERAAKNFFLETVRQNDDGRYEVRLPWLEEHPPLPDNYNLANRRLNSTVRRLKSGGLLQDYNNVFQEWLNEGIIEIVPNFEVHKRGHYLPHRPVIKESSLTTKVRPVFDASAKERDNPSLNQCLEKGPNLIEQIPHMLLRFRLRQVGVVSDIRKAFLQISLHEDDRDFLRFFWIDSNGEKVVYRHKRVVFGVSSSPFLLGATIEYHLSKFLEKCNTSNTPYSRDTIERLTESFYVDNCVASVSNEDALKKFVDEATGLMADGQFELRGWEFSHNPQGDDPLVPVLGLTWEPKEDILTINKNCIKNIKDDLQKPITKRLILSIAQRIFDPIGFTCPVTLCPKLLLQKMWNLRIGWDGEVDAGIEKEFRKWVTELPGIMKIQIHRWICGEEKQLSLHTFCDASKDAYAATIFLRVIQNGQTHVFLLAAKTRVAPLKNASLSIPRLELLAATIGARLYTGVRDNFKNQEIGSYFWSDSATVISWIKRAEQWSTFVWNRVVEIRKLTTAETWRHLPGTDNPADLPSRGCSVTQLLKSRWWEGPPWLRETSDQWPPENSQYDEDEISSERRKTCTTTLLNVDGDFMHLRYFSKYKKIVRLVSWVFRFIHNSRNPAQKLEGPLLSEEFDKAEIFIFKTIQCELFQDENDTQIRTLHPFWDNEGVLRVRSRISNREDSEDFCHPIVLPSKHPVVRRLIFDHHLSFSHVGTQGLLSMLRERFWILGGRRAIRSVISKCVTCRRQESQPFTVEAPPLPTDRVRDAVAFEVTGVDFAGPMLLRNGKKIWICLFTCAVYRAVHLELASSLSTECFLQTFRRFVARRGRPKTVYSDNGSNFVGAVNAFRKLDWRAISQYTSAQRITWKFNPPTAAWWGGFWERLIGSVKRLLRKVLGRASLNYEDLSTLLCECEAVINSRPLTYMSENPAEMVALTPAMFLRDQVECGLPDCDEVDGASLRRKASHRQQLRDSLKKRFRNEYLGQLQRSRRNHTARRITAGEIVLIGNDHNKRIDWPLGRVEGLVRGSDGEIRLVRVVTANGQLLRPVQRLYPLECVVDLTADHKAPTEKEIQKVDDAADGGDSDSAGVHDAPGIQSRVPDNKPIVTRSGRRIRLPERYHM